MVVKSPDYVSLFVRATHCIREVFTFTHWIGGNRKRSYLSTNADQKYIETVFSIAISRQSGDKWQSKTQFLNILDLRLSR